MLRRFAVQHFLGSLSTLILHDCREVAVGPPAVYKRVDVNLVEAGRVERHPACLFEVEIPERRAERRLRERHGAAHTLRVALREAEESVRSRAARADCDWLRDQ